MSGNFIFVSFSLKQQFIYSINDNIHVLMINKKKNFKWNIARLKIPIYNQAINLVDRLHELLIFFYNPKKLRSIDRIKNCDWLLLWQKKKKNEKKSTKQNFNFNVAFVN